jgi:peptidyl-prolyl cis-trans isomerase SurA
VRQLVDERLRLQEIQRRHVVVTDAQIAESIRGVETRNNLPPDALRQKLQADGVGFHTLVDQIRVQIGWAKVVREAMGGLIEVSAADVAEQQRLLKLQAGKPEYRVSEIFIPVREASQNAEAQRFAETIITQLRGGAAFAVIAAQFSQSQTALEGGDLGWVQPSQLDPTLARLVTQMPENAVSNPTPVPGGISIVSLRGKRTVGEAAPSGVTLHMRQIFLPFTAPLNATAPTDQQRETLAKANSLAATLHSCEQVEAAAKANNSPRPPDPGDVLLEGVSPPTFRAMLASLPEGKVSKPLVSPDGIALVMVCSRGTHDSTAETDNQIKERLVGERAELVSRQLLNTLRRRAVIDIKANLVTVN